MARGEHPPPLRLANCLLSARSSSHNLLQSRLVYYHLPKRLANYLLIPADVLPSRQAKNIMPTRLPKRKMLIYLLTNLCQHSWFNNSF